MINRKWRSVGAVSGVQNGYWNVENEVLDLTNLTNLKSDTTQMYFQEIDGKK